MYPAIDRRSIVRARAAWLCQFVMRLFASSRSIGQSLTWPRALATVLAMSLVGIGPWQSARAADPTSKSSGSDVQLMLLPLAVDGDIPASHQRDYLDQLSTRLGDGPYVLLSPDSPSVAADLARCRNFRCEAKVAATAGAHMMLRTRIAVRDRNYTLQIDLYEASTAKLLATSEEGCDLCGLGEMRDVVAARASVVREKIESLLRQSANITIRSDPDGAELKIDGEALGQTPAQLFVAPGEHRVEVTKPGFAPSSKAVTVVRGVREIVEFELQEEQAVATPVRRFDRDGDGKLVSKRGWGWLSMVAGVGSLATGLTFLALDERPFARLCDDPANIDTNGTCRYRYDTTTSGIVFTAVGGILATTGLVLLIKTRNDPGRASVALSPNGAHLRLRF